MRPEPNHERADAYAQELCIDAMYDNTLKGNLAAAYLALKQENLGLRTEIEMARFVIKHSEGTCPNQMASCPRNVFWYNTTKPPEKP